MVSVGKTQPKAQLFHKQPWIFINRSLIANKTARCARDDHSSAWFNFQNFSLSILFYSLIFHSSVNSFWPPNAPNSSTWGIEHVRPISYKIRIVGPIQIFGYRLIKIFLFFNYFQQFPAWMKITNMNMKM